MGRIVFTVEGSTVGTVAEGRGVVVEYQVSEQDSAKLVAAMADFHKGDLVDADGVPVQPTIELILKAWFNGCVRQALRQTADYERRKAAVQPITVTGL
jgi:hypothetical protein